VISQKVIDRVLDSGIEEVAFGEIIAIHGNSLSLDSKWLDDEKVPILWIDKGQQPMDPEASTRRFFAIQILFPEYMTTATFFVRPFLAGNAAACQIALTTLGPPAVDKEYFLRRLLKYRLETEKESRISSVDQTIISEEEKKEVARLRLVNVLSQLEPPFQSNSINIKEIEKLDILDEKEARGEIYKREHKKIIKESAMWPGRFIPSPNWRENNSLTFTTDFFGRPEAIATVRALYDQISRAILDSLSSLGFDISDYYSEGRYSIHAERIEEIVIGEKVYVEKSGIPEKLEGAEAPSPSRVQERAHKEAP